MDRQNFYRLNECDRYTTLNVLETDNRISIVKNDKELIQIHIVVTA